MNPQLVQVLAGLSSLLGFLSILAYFYTVSQGRRAERSLNEIVGSSSLFSADQVVEILQSFKEEARRLEALERLTHLDRGRAEDLLGQIKSNVDIGKLQASADRHRLAVIGVGGAVLLLLGVLGLISSARTATSTESPLQAAVNIDAGTYDAIELMGVLAKNTGGLVIAPSVMAKMNGKSVRFDLPMKRVALRAVLDQAFGQLSIQVAYSINNGTVVVSEGGS